MYSKEKNRETNFPSSQSKKRKKKKKIALGARAMAPWLRARSVLANDLSSCLAPTHLRLLRVVCDCSAKEFDALLWLLWATGLLCIYPPHRHTSVHIILIIKINLKMENSYFNMIHLKYLKDLSNIEISCADKCVLCLKELF